MVLPGIRGGDGRWAAGRRAGRACSRRLSGGAAGAGGDGGGVPGVAAGAGSGGAVRGRRVARRGLRGRADGAERAGRRRPRRTGWPRRPRPLLPDLRHRPRPRRHHSRLGGRPRRLPPRPSSPSPALSSSAPFSSPAHRRLVHAGQQLAAQLLCPCRPRPANSRSSLVALERPVDPRRLGRTRVLLSRSDGTTGSELPWRLLASGGHCTSAKGSVRSGSCRRAQSFAAINGQGAGRGGRIMSPTRPGARAWPQLSRGGHRTPRQVRASAARPLHGSPRPPRRSQPSSHQRREPPGRRPGAAAPCA